MCLPQQIIVARQLDVDEMTERRCGKKPNGGDGESAGVADLGVSG